MHFVAKQGLEEMIYLKPKVKKMRSVTKCGRPNMALHLNEGFKDQKGGLGGAHLSNPFFGINREEKGEKS